MFVRIIIKEFRKQWTELRLLVVMYEWNQIPTVGSDNFLDLVDAETLVDEPTIEELNNES